MVEPISAGTLAAITAISGAMQGAGSYMGAREQAKAMRKQSKETKRKTFADLLNDAMNRSSDSVKDTRHTQNEFSGARAKAMQDLAAGIRQSLGR